MHLRKPFSVLVVIYNHNNEFLLIRRADDPNFWQSVTGGVERNELPLETAYRELKEETGIDAKALGIAIHDHQTTNHYEIRPCWRHRYEPGSIINTEHVFSICVPNDVVVELDPNEHTDFQWLDKEAALEKAWSPSNQQEIANLQL